MYVGIDMNSNITLGKNFFVKHGTVNVGSYEYDEPENADDPRSVNYGGVPAIAFSEALGDLAKIAGKSQTQPDGKRLMLDWLKSLGGKKPFENKVGLDPA